MYPSIYELYRQLTPNTARTNVLVHVLFNDMTSLLEGRDILHVLKTHRGHRPKNDPDAHISGSGTHQNDIKQEQDDVDGLTAPEATEHHECLLYSGTFESQRVRLIDSNLVMSRVSPKVLKTLGQTEDEASLSTFNNLDSAVESLFKTKEYSVVRVTRSASSSEEGSVLMKLESAAPGDLSLIDDRDFMEDMLASLGVPGQAPNAIFLKKVVARPRYKSDMKIYIVPTAQCTLLYTDERVFFRDIVNGVIDTDIRQERQIFTTFAVDQVLAQILELFLKTTRLDSKLNSPPDVPTSVSSVSTTLLSNPSIMSLTGLSSTDISSVSTPEDQDLSKDLQYISNKDGQVLRFDTDYTAGGL